MNLEQKKESYIEIEENIFMLRCIEENLRLISTSCSSEEMSISSALYGIVAFIDGQVNEIENKLS
jgi:hypothetical protein